jgi:putative flippase GtrA
VANSVGMFVSYYGSRHYAFRHRDAAGPGAGLARYVAINLASFVIPVMCLWLTRHVFHWDSIYADNISGNVVGALLGNAVRFWAFRRFVFPSLPAAPRSFWETPPADDGTRDVRSVEDLSEVDP